MSCSMWYEMIPVDVPLLRSVCELPLPDQPSRGQMASCLARARAWPRAAALVRAAAPARDRAPAREHCILPGGCAHIEYLVSRVYAHSIQGSQPWESEEMAVQTLIGVRATMAQCPICHIPTPTWGLPGG
jgi:hypothetical protein